MNYHTRIRDQTIINTLNNHGLTPIEDVYREIQKFKKNKICRDERSIKVDYLLDQIRAKNTISIFLIDGGAIEGIIVFVFSRDRQFCSILGLCTKRSLGYGRTLINTVKQICAAVGTKTLFLEAYDEIAGVYTSKFGFSLSSKKKKDINITVEIDDSDSESDDENSRIKGTLRLYELDLTAPAAAAAASVPPPRHLASTTAATAAPEETLTKLPAGIVNPRKITRRHSVTNIPRPRRSSTGRRRRKSLGGRGRSHRRRRRPLNI